MMLELSSEVRVKPGEELDALPRGMALDYVVGYYDNVGTKFNAGQRNIAVSTNRADLAAFGTTTENVINVKFTRNGHMVAKIYDEKHPNGMFDYVNMIIGDILFPPKVRSAVYNIIM